MSARVLRECDSLEVAGWVTKTIVPAYSHSPLELTYLKVIVDKF